MIIKFVKPYNDIKQDGHERTGVVNRKIYVGVDVIKSGVNIKIAVDTVVHISSEIIIQKIMYDH